MLNLSPLLSPNLCRPCSRHISTIYPKVDVPGSTSINNIPSDPSRPWQAKCKRCNASQARGNMPRVRSSLTMAVGAFRKTMGISPSLFLGGTTTVECKQSLVYFDSEAASQHFMGNKNQLYPPLSPSLVAP